MNRYSKKKLEDLTLKEEIAILKAENKNLRKMLDEEHEMGIKAANNLYDSISRLDFYQNKNKILENGLSNIKEELSCIDGLPMTRDLMAVFLERIEKIVSECLKEVNKYDQ